MSKYKPIRGCSGREGKCRPFNFEEAKQVIGLRVQRKEILDLVDTIVGAYRKPSGTLMFKLAVNSLVPALVLLDEYEFVMTPPWVPRYWYDARKRRPDLRVCGAVEVEDTQ